MALPYSMSFSEASPSGSFQNYSSYLENCRRYNSKVNQKVVENHRFSKQKTYCTLRYDKYSYITAQNIYNQCKQQDQKKIIIELIKNAFMSIHLCGITHKKYVNEVTFIKN